MTRMTRCPACGGIISVNASICPRSGAILNRTSSPGQDCYNVCDRSFVRYLPALLVNPSDVVLESANLDATQCKMARAALGIEIQDLAVMAGVSPDVVFRLEKGETLHQRTVIAIREALELAGLEVH